MESPLPAGDRLAIHELIALHGHLADDRRPEELDRLLTTDAAYDLSDFGLGIIDGLDAITDLHRRRPGNQPVGHHVTNVMIEEVDGAVHVRSKGLSVMAGGAAGTCTYEDTVIRTEGGWRIARRRIRAARTD